MNTIYIFEGTELLILPCVLYLIPMLILWCSAINAIKKEDKFFFSWFLLVSFVPILNLLMSLFITFEVIGDLIIKYRKSKNEN